MKKKLTSEKSQIVESLLSTLSQDFDPTSDKSYPYRWVKVIKKWVTGLSAVVKNNTKFITNVFLEGEAAYPW